MLNSISQNQIFVLNTSPALDKLHVSSHPTYTNIKFSSSGHAKPRYVANNSWQGKEESCSR